MFATMSRIVATQVQRFFFLQTTILHKLAKLYKAKSRYVYVLDHRLLYQLGDHRFTNPSTGRLYFRFICILDLNTSSLNSLMKSFGCYAIRELYISRNFIVHIEELLAGYTEQRLIPFPSFIPTLIICIIRECGSTLYVGMTRTAARATYRLILK